MGAVPQIFYALLILGTSIVLGGAVCDLTITEKITRRINGSDSSRRGRRAGKSHAVPEAIFRGVEEAVGFFFAWVDFQGSPAVANHAPPLHDFFPARVHTVEGCLSLEEEVQGMAWLFSSNMLRWQVLGVYNRTQSQLN